MTGELDYAQALAFIHGATGIGKKNGLENMRALLARLGNPQQQFPSVHIAGTNGKGSVCAFVHAGLVCAGKNTGLYTSPFLQRYNERIRINGVPVSDAALAAVASRIKREVDALRQENISPTEFEIGTVAAFLYFAQQQVDYAVVEVGLGGRLDPTNVLLPRICAIASIGLDHTHILGDTLEKIALEKAGIAKPGVPLVLSAQVQGEASEAIAAHCRAVGAPLLRAQPERDCPLACPGTISNTTPVSPGRCLRRLEHRARRFLMACVGRAGLLVWSGWAKSRLFCLTARTTRKARKRYDSTSPLSREEKQCFCAGSCAIKTIPVSCAHWAKFAIRLSLSVQTAAVPLMLRSLPRHFPA